LCHLNTKPKRCMTEGLFNDANTIAAASAVIYSAHKSGIKPYGLLEIERDIWPRYKKAFEAFERNVHVKYSDNMICLKIC